MNVKTGTTGFKTLRKVFAGVFIVSLFVLLGSTVMMLRNPRQSDPIYEETKSSDAWQKDIQLLVLSQQDKSPNQLLIKTSFGSLVSTILSLVTMRISWRQEQRASRREELEIRKMELELQQNRQDKQQA